MGQKASKPAEASEPAVPLAADAAQQPQTNPLSQPVIKDQTRESQVQETPATRLVAALPPKPSFQPDPKNSVTSSEPAVVKLVAQQVAPVSAIAKAKSKEQVAEKQVTPKQPIQSKPPAQKQPAQPKQQRQQKPITAQQQKSVTAQQQPSGSSKRPIPQKAATQSQQVSPAKAVQQVKPSPQKPQSQQKPSQSQQKPSQQPTAATLQRPQAQQKQQPPVILPTKPVKAKKPKQAKQPQQSTLSPNAKLPRKPITTLKTDAPVVGGSLRARMSSPPKLIITEVIVNRDGQGQGSAATSGVPAPSHAPTGLASTVSISSVSSKSGEKRRLNEEDDLDPIRPADPSVLAHTSPQHRQRKIVRRDGDTDTASAQESDAKSVAAVPEVVVQEEEKEEGEISDEEMEMPPPPPPSSKTSLLDRLSDVHVADSTTSIPHSTLSAAGGSGSLSARMDPALMARIDPRGTPFASSTSNLYGQPPRAPFAPYSAKHSMRNGKPNQPIPGFPSSTPNAPAQLSQTARVADVLMKDVEQPRMKGVVGRSGNQTTVNGVAIPTGKGHGENQLDEAGQRELIEIIVELHNKGISTDELTQRGVPAQLVNRVMRALAKPAPVSDPKSLAPATSSSEARPATANRHPTRNGVPPPSSTSTQAEAEHDVDMDMDIDSENEKSPNVPWNVPQMPVHAQPMFYPPMPMMPMMHMPPFPPPLAHLTVPALPPHPAPNVPPPPPPPSSSALPPPPPPVEPKLSLMELKAKLIASRKLKQRSAGAETPDASDLDTPTMSEFVAKAIAPAQAVVAQLTEQETASQSLEKIKLSPLPANLLVQSLATSRAESPTITAQSVGPFAVPQNAPPPTAVHVNSRRPGAADFVDVPPSRLASSTFFRSNVRKTFAPPQPKRLVVDLDDTSDDGSDSDGESNSDSKMASLSAEPGNEEDALRLMHEAELRIALERKRAELLEKRAKLNAYAARKKAAAQLAAENATATPSPVLISTGMALAPPSISEAPSVSPTISRASVEFSETSVPVLDPTVDTSKDTDHMRDKGKQQPKSRAPQTTRPQSTATGKTHDSIIDLTDDTENSQVPTVTAPASAHFKPYHFFTPHPLTSTPSSSHTGTDTLDLDQLKNISLSRMMAEHRERTGKAEEDPVVCKYELRGGSCNVPDCPDFHMRKEIIASQQDLLRYIDMVLPAKKNSPPTLTAAREHLQQLVRAKPDIPKPEDAGPSDSTGDGTSDSAAHAKAQKIKLIRQRKAPLLCQTRKLAVDQFLDELRKTLQSFAVPADSSTR